MQVRINLRKWRIWLEKVDATKFWILAALLNHVMRTDLLRAVIYNLSKK